MSYTPSESVDVTPLSPGHRGIEETVSAMRELAREDSVSPLVVRFARRFRHGSDFQRARLIRRFLSDRTRFEFDPPDLELVRYPVTMLREIERTGTARGDCDDVATLGAALGLASGLAARFVLVGLAPGAPFEHVYTDLMTSRGPVELDVTRPAQFPPGLVVRRLGFREV